jgi:hypothetical protein
MNLSLMSWTELVGSQLLSQASKEGQRTDQCYPSWTPATVVTGFTWPIQFRGLGHRLASI